MMLIDTLAQKHLIKTRFLTCYTQRKLLRPCLDVGKYNDPPVDDIL